MMYGGVKMSYMFLSSGCPHIVDNAGRFYENRQFDSKGQRTGAHRKNIYLKFESKGLFQRAMVQAYSTMDPSMPVPEFFDWMNSKHNDYQGYPNPAQWQEFAVDVVSGESPNLEHLLIKKPAPGSIVIFTKKADDIKNLRNLNLYYQIRKIDELVEFPDNFKF